MTLETIGDVSETRAVSLPAMAGWYGGPARRGVQLLHHGLGHDLHDWNASPVTNFGLLMNDIDQVLFACPDIVSWPSIEPAIATRQRATLKEAGCRLEPDDTAPERPLPVAGWRQAP
jgi:hypothetical protein